ncbi:hypothetical protein KMP11_06525 [Gemella sp. zg-570]|uniref:hypothetical protein n=1 Tax=Gemella sp. zg-570 TaxID=2840371 RepID=UPI001C0E14F6|nr:hypothetical protein [Gemella sp. zg-570]QWQ38597.1 hypothetical protein KMP11_06525 [Gemella sp. zg-570]
MNTQFKILSAVLSASLLITPIYALTHNYKNVVRAAELSNNDEFQRLYNRLNYNKKIEFNKLKKELKLTKKQQLEILKDKEIMDNQPTDRWKLAVIKKIAKWISLKVGEKSVAEITDYLLEWEDDLQTGIENFLVEYCGFSRGSAHWTAKTAMFIAF